MQGALLDGFIEHGDGLAIHLLGGGLVAFFDGFAQIAQRVRRLEVLARLRAVRCSVWRARLTPKNDLPCLVRYLCVY